MRWDRGAKEEKKEGGSKRGLFSQISPAENDSLLSPPLQWDLRDSLKTAFFCKLLARTRHAERQQRRQRPASFIGTCKPHSAVLRSAL
ncbi:hypothetical protein SRHO_G00211810 [Serrasalmus rhombeus]